MFIKSSNTPKNNQKRSDRLATGFTIVELLVVIVVIAILAAITVVSYAGITQKATAATLQSDLKNASTQLEMDKTTNGTYPATKEGANGNKGLHTSSDTTFDYIYNSSNDKFALVATNKGITYHITSSNETPVEGAIATTVNWEQISVGYWHTCAIANEQAYCWGENSHGELGNNSTDDSNIPVAVDTNGVLAGKTVTAISTGQSHTCAVANGQAYCWGENGYDGKFGDGTRNNSLVPVAVDTGGVLAGKTVTAISAGYYNACAIADGKAYCWGNYNGRGNGTSDSSLVPVAVDTNGVLSGKTVTAISSGYYNSCTIASERAYCWGEGWKGKLGNNSTVDSDIPVAVDINGVLSGKTVTAITSGYWHTCAVANGQAYCWGNNSYGHLGNGIDDGGNSGNMLTPVAVVNTGVLANKTVTAVTNREDHTCAIANGQAYCWGSNGNGRLGNNSTANSSPVPVTVNNNNILTW